MSAMFGTLSKERKAHLSVIADRMVLLGIPPETSDILIGVLILEAAERQFVDDGGARPPNRESTLEILRPLFEVAKSPPNPKGSN
jgi:hypothetical protein